MPVFYFPEISGKDNFLDETESKHCIRVLRMTRGDPIRLIDGKGGFYLAEITQPDPRKCSFRITEILSEYGRREFRLHIAIAPTKGMDRFEWFIEKSTEIGIDEITPLLCDRSERKSINPDRLEKVIIAAMKQSVRAYKPALHPSIPFHDFLRFNFQDSRFIAYCGEGTRPVLKQVCPAGKNCLVMIGPEGDFSPAETTAAKEWGWQEVSLGDGTLRTETAGVVACATVNLVNQ